MKTLMLFVLLTVTGNSNTSTKFAYYGDNLTVINYQPVMTAQVIVERWTPSGYVYMTGTEANIYYCNKVNASVFIETPSRLRVTLITNDCQGNVRQVQALIRNGQSVLIP